MRPPMAFLSYAHFNDDLDRGYITEFRRLLALEVEAQTGDPFPIFQDRADLFWGEVGQAQIERQIQSVTFLLPVLTPTFFRSKDCRKEVEGFLVHEQRLGRTDLILPLYYIKWREFDDYIKPRENEKEVARIIDPLVKVLADRQYKDWRLLRYCGLDTTTARQELTNLALQIESALYRGASTRQDASEPVSGGGLEPTSIWVPVTSRLDEKEPPTPIPPSGAFGSDRLEATDMDENDRFGGSPDATQRVLILTENKVLSYQCEAILRSKNFECLRVEVDEDFSPEALIDTIIREGQGIVLCEYRMSSYYSALSLLRDLTAASLASRVKVIALVLDDSDLDEFFFLGGTTYGVLKPGSRDVKSVIEEAWQRLERRRNSIVRSRTEVIAYLNSLKDERVFRQFAVDLFTHLDYREVHLTHGIREAGKDLVFYEQNRMGELEYVGVQANIGDIHGGNVAALMAQAAKAFNSEVTFGGVRHYLDKYVIMASGTVNNEARQMIDRFLRDKKYNKRFYIWGREKIAHVKVHYAPGFIRFQS